ncbi:MAG: hypothetical protein KAS23_17360 [Anaerohalosphaera sp.]|nr:hypothetical protein [Anaerohalosphaera sp.]
MNSEILSESVQELDKLFNLVYAGNDTDIVNAIQRLTVIVKGSRYVYVRDRASEILDAPFTHDTLDDMIRKKGDHILGLAVDPSQKELLDDELSFTSFLMDIQDLGYVYRKNSNSVAWRLLDNIFESNSFPDKIRDCAGIELGYTWGQRYIQIHPWTSEAIIAFVAAIIAAVVVELGIELYYSH